MSSIREIVTPSGVVIKVSREDEYNVIDIRANSGGPLVFMAMISPGSWSRFKRALATVERMMLDEGWLDMSTPEGGSLLELVRGKCSYGSNQTDKNLLL
jgi:hypothetical protein